MPALSGRVALVTGGTAGIGLATTLAFAREGAGVVAVGRDASRGAELTAAAADLAGEVRFFAADVADPAQVEASFDACLAWFHRLDFAVNNAATGGPGGRCADVAIEDFDRTMAVNVRGLWLCMRRELRIMVDQGGGAIVNVSSLDGLTGSPDASVYSASKHAVNGLTKTAAMEYAPAGIRVNAICPGGIATEMLAGAYGHDLAWTERYRRPGIPAGRLGRPEECAAAALWLCSESASYLTGVCLPVDGGVLADSASYLPLRAITPRDGA